MNMKYLQQPLDVVLWWWNRCQYQCETCWLFGMTGVQLLAQGTLWHSLQNSKDITRNPLITWWLNLPPEMCCLIRWCIFGLSSGQLLTSGFSLTGHDLTAVNPSLGLDVLPDVWTLSENRSCIPMGCNLFYGMKWNLVLIYGPQRISFYEVIPLASIMRLSFVG